MRRYPRRNVSLWMQQNRKRRRAIRRREMRKEMRMMSLFQTTTCSRV